MDWLASICRAAGPAAALCMLVCGLQHSPTGMGLLTRKAWPQGFRVGVMRQILDTSTADGEFTGLFNAALGDLAAAGAPDPGLVWQLPIVHGQVFVATVQVLSFLFAR